MPCRLCQTMSEWFPQPARFRTPLMAVAIPYFNAKKDFLCPDCFRVYYESIELKYGDKIKKYLHWTQDASSAPPPPPPPPSIAPPAPELECTAYSSRFAPMFVGESMAAARRCVWNFDFRSPPLAGVTPAAWTYWKTYRDDMEDFRVETPETPEPPIPFPPIEAHASITVDFPIEESKANMRLPQAKM